MYICTKSAQNRTAALEREYQAGMFGQVKIWLGIFLIFDFAQLVQRSSDESAEVIGKLKVGWFYRE